MYGTVPLAASFSEKGMDGRRARRLHDELRAAQPAADDLHRGARRGGARGLARAAAFLCGAAAGFLVRRFFRGRLLQLTQRSTENRDTDPNLAARLLKNMGPQRQRHSAGLPRRRRADRRAHASRPVARDSGSLRRKRLRHSPPRRSRACRSTSAAAARYRCSPKWMGRGMGPRPPPSPSCSPAPATKLTNLGALKTVPRRAQLRAIHSLRNDIRRCGGIRRGRSPIVPFFPQSAPPQATAAGLFTFARTGADYIALLC